MKDVKDFTTYLKVEKNYSNYTIKNYQLDIESFLDDCKENNIDYLKITYQEARSYVNRLYNEKHEKATSVSRKISSIRSFYRYLANNKKENYSFHLLKLPKKGKRLPKYLEYNEIDEIFDIPNLEEPLGIRNSLILEMLYATGMRVGELVSIKVNDINMNTKLKF